MNQDDINFSSEVSSGKKISKLALSAYSIIFFVVFTISLVAVIFAFILKVNASNLVTANRNLRAEIDSNKLKKEKLLITSERLSTVSQIVGSRSSLDSTVLSILSQIPDSFSLESVSASNDNILISMIGDGLSDFADLLSNKLPEMAENKQLGIISIKVDTFSRESSGYLLSLSFKLGSEK